ncbi:peptidyl-prolyl cis-trans isomerase FKBP8, partial [Clonorchis sinensis]
QTNEFSDSLEGIKDHTSPDVSVVDGIVDRTPAGDPSQLHDQIKETTNAYPETDTCEDEIIDILAKGLGRESRPNHGDLVEVSFKGYLEDGTIVDDVASMVCTLGDGDVIQALDLSLPLAERDERFELVTDARFAYGSLGRDPDIPGDATLRYEVHLLSSSDPPSYSSLSDPERLSMADQKRERGNYYYRREEYAFAVNSYNKALKLLSVPTANQSTERTASTSELLEELEIKLLNNLAATQLKIQAYDAAVKSCNAVLQRDPRNFKALFRKGKALLEQAEVDEAIPILRLVHEMVPSSSMVASELRRARCLQQRERERWSRAASKMFSQHDSRSIRPRSRFFGLQVPVLKYCIFTHLVCVTVVRRFGTDELLAAKRRYCSRGRKNVSSTLPGFSGFGSTCWMQTDLGQRSLPDVYRFHMTEKDRLGQRERRAAESVRMTNTVTVAWLLWYMVYD